MFYDDMSIESLAAHRMFAMGRPHSAHGFGHGGSGFMGGHGGGDFRWARKLGSKDLQLLILSLLGERPAHGYELIKTIEERSGGFYTPSPGMIYPALTYLEEIGQAVVTVDGNRKLYAITEAGQASLDAHREEATTILEALSRPRRAHCGRARGVHRRGLARPASRRRTASSPP